MTVHTATGTATDPMTATDTDTVTINSTASAALRVVHRSFMENRQMWGFVGDTTPRGPSFSDVTLYGQTFYPGLPAPITLSMCFNVQIPVRFTGCRIYKAPNAAGTAIPVTLWQAADPPGEGTTGTVLASTTFNWTADAGGWRQITFPAPVNLVPGVEYVLGYFAADGIFAYTQWVWHGQDTCVWPLHNIQLYDLSSGSIHGTRTLVASSTFGFPVFHVAHNFYIDPQVEWDDPLPAGFGNPAYWDQWTKPHTRHAFPIGVFQADPPYLDEYYDMGVNTLFAATPVVGGDAQAHIDAIAATGTGYSMDWWPHMAGDATSSTFNPFAAVVQLQDEYPGLADCIVGYLIGDEPDIVLPYSAHTPDIHRAWITALRQVDSTRPIYMTFSQIANRNQRYFGNPEGTWLVKNVAFRDWARNLDAIACDDYVWYYDNNAWGIFGVWNYAAQVGRMRELCDDRTPVWAVVETCGNVPDAPTPTQVLRAVWAALIAGARCIILFDHRFPGPYLPQDFAAMLHDPPMKAAVTTLCARLQTLGPALLAADLGLVTAYTSSNTTAGPQGGTWGVPLHYTSRTDGTYQYVFAQAIRTGTTNATLTIPAWAGLTVTVLDESRTETVSGGGVLTDTFTGDCEYHLYRRTL